MNKLPVIQNVHQPDNKSKYHQGSILVHQILPDKLSEEWQDW